MTKEQAQRLVQEKLKVAREALAEAAAAMDEHKFTVDFMDLAYLPRGLEYDDEKAMDGIDPLGIGLYIEGGGQGDYNKYYAGKWLPSSRYRGC